MIALKDSMPPDLFQPAWEEINRLVYAGKWNIFETVAEELRDDWLRDWLKDHVTSVIDFNADINLYMTQFMAECQRNNVTLVNPHNTRNNADPFVVMLALYFEARDLQDLRLTTTDIKCCVLTNEIPKDHKINIPYVCDYYRIPYMNLYDFMRYHGWKFSITIGNP